MKGLRHGEGIMSYHVNKQKASSPNTQFKGIFQFDEKDGLGTILFFDGSRYLGSFKHNLQDYGTYYWPQNFTESKLREYTGFWKGHIMQG